MSSKDFIEAEGIVKEVRSSGVYLTLLDNGQEMLTHVSGKMKKSHIRILVGDRVKVEISTYDLTKGRIVRRLTIKKVIQE